MLSWYFDAISSWHDPQLTRASDALCGNSSVFARSAWQSTHAIGPCVDWSNSFASTAIALPSSRLAPASPWQARQSSFAGGLGAGCAAAGPAKSQAAARATIVVVRTAGLPETRPRRLLLQTAYVRHERIHVVLGQRVLLHLGLACGFGLGGHRLGVHDPAADFIRAQRTANAVERPFRVALAGDRMAQRALLRREDRFAFSPGILSRCRGRRCKTDNRCHHHCTHVRPSCCCFSNATATVICRQTRWQSIARAGYPVPTPDRAASRIRRLR